MQSLREGRTVRGSRCTHGTTLTFVKLGREQDLSATFNHGVRGIPDANKSLTCASTRTGPIWISASSACVNTVGSIQVLAARALGACVAITACVAVGLAGL